MTTTSIKWLAADLIYFHYLENEFKEHRGKNVITSKTKHKIKSAKKTLFYASVLQACVQQSSLISTIDDSVIIPLHYRSYYVQLVHVPTPVQELQRLLIQQACFVKE